MSTLRRQPDPAAEEQASLWAARLEGGTLPAPDREALDVWLNADSRHRALLSSYCQFSADLEEQLLALVATGGVKLPPEPPAETEMAPVIKVTRWNFPRIAGIALATAAAIAVALWVARPGVRVETVATAAAQRSSITLSDGTRVELNARTRFTFENGPKERHAKLAGGEAFFTVAKDSSRPFIIDTPAGSVRVTGTVFNVRTDTPADLEVVVVEGSVQVQPSTLAGGTPNGTQMLRANEALTAQGGAARPRILSSEELADALAWRQGLVVFKDVPLRSVFKQFANYHGKEIYLSAAVEQSKKTVSGRYSIDDLETSLRNTR